MYTWNICGWPSCSIVVNACAHGQSAAHRAHAAMSPKFTVKSALEGEKSSLPQNQTAKEWVLLPDDGAYISSISSSSREWRVNSTYLSSNVPRSRRFVTQSASSRALLRNPMVFSARTLYCPVGPDNAHG